jgi:hypothetical protein
MVDMYEEPTTPANCNYDVVENCLSFGQALDKLIERENDDTDNNEYGIRIRTWPEGIVIRIQTPDVISKMNMTQRYLYKNHKGKNIPWVPNNEFIFNHFWELVKFVKNKDVIPENETINKLIASIHNKKNYEAWFRNPDIQKEFDNCRSKYEELKKDYIKYSDLVTKDKKSEDNNKCAPHCAKKCLNECHKAKVNPNSEAKAIVIADAEPNCKVKEIIIKGNLENLADSLDKIIDNLLG